MKKIKVIICGDDNEEHTTFVEYDGQYFEFYFNGYEGMPAKEVCEFLKFLGYEIFELHNSNFKRPLTCINK